MLGHHILPILTQVTAFYRNVLSGQTFQCSNKTIVCENYPCWKTKQSIINLLELKSKYSFGNPSKPMSVKTCKVSDIFDGHFLNSNLGII